MRKKGHIYSIKLMVPVIAGLALLVTMVVIAASLFLLSKQVKDLTAFKLASLQRMLSQKIMKDALLYKETKDPGTLEGLVKAAELFERSLLAMEKGDKELGIPGPVADEEVLQECERLQKMWRPFFENVMVIEGSSFQSNEASAALQYLRSHNLELLRQADVLAQKLEMSAMGKISGFRVFLYAMAIVGVALLFGVFPLTSRLLVRPMENMVRAMKETAYGRFNKVPVPEGPRELRELWTAFNCFSAFIIGQFSSLNIQNGILGEARKLIEESSGKIKRYGENTRRIAEDVAASASYSTENLEAVFSATKDMSTATSEIAQSVNTTANKANEAQEQAISASQAISRLSESSEKIGQVIQVINSIAEQTNLLALNATIEAARAGEAGKGFAVVANEVKELAKQTGLATEEIKQMVETIQEDTRHAVSAVQSITGRVSEVNDFANTIASATEEQTATVSEMTMNIERATDGARGVKTNAESLLDHSREFSRLRSELDVIEKGVRSITTEGLVLMSQVTVNPDILTQMQKYLPMEFKIKSIIYQHLQWRDKVISGIIQEIPPEVETDPHRCALGKFLDSYQTTRPEVRDVLSRLIPVHDRLHKSVVNLQEGITKGLPRKDIMVTFETDIEPLFNEILELLSDWMAIEGRRSSFTVQLETAPKQRPAGPQKPAKNFIEWGPDFETGLKSIDEQHRKLVDMVNTLYDAMQQKKGKEVLGRLLDELIDYTVYHFGTEEEYFKRCDYPEAASHKKIHEGLASKVMDFKEKFQKGEAMLSYDLMNFLKNWLANHICVTDKEYAPFLKSKGID